MSAPRIDPAVRQIELAQEAARLMWRTYELHFQGNTRCEDWREKARELFAKCQEADARVCKLKELRARMMGPGGAGGGLYPHAELSSGIA